MITSIDLYLFLCDNKSWPENRRGKMGIILGVLDTHHDGMMNARLLNGFYHDSKSINNNNVTLIQLDRLKSRKNIIEVGIMCLS